jgi:molybdopterin/thiamine biosynthesis adenylyltransferase
MRLSREEQEKYQRHFLIEGFSEDHQLKLKNAKVLVIGAGGLGSPVLLYLTAAGIGTIGIVEYDSVVLSNLPRQVLYTQQDIGEQKATKAREKMLAMNPHCQILLYQHKWQGENAEQIAGNFDLLIDCTDNHASRYLSDAVSKKLNIPFIYGAVHQLEGQVAVFNFKGSKGYIEFFTDEKIPDTRSPLGVLGPAAGTVGNIMAAETIKIIVGVGEVLLNQMLFISLRYNRYQIFQF